MQNNRYADCSRRMARGQLAVLAATLLAAALIPLGAAPVADSAERPDAGQVLRGKALGEAKAGRDDDLALYDRIIARLAAGEGYYAAAAAEQRAGGYPLRPGFAMRLPTLATFQAWVGPFAAGLTLIALMAAVGWAWWRRLGEEPQTRSVRAIGTALILFGTSLSLNPEYTVMHEVWAGNLIALSLALYRPGQGSKLRWIAALMAATLALAVRELALPFVLLLAALALWYRNWREAAGWGLLAAVFAGAMVWHLQLVEAQIRPSDPLGPSWLALQGPAGWLGAVIRSSALDPLPQWLSAPLVVLMLLGWSGIRSRFGLTASLLLLGYAAALMIAGRANNFYWGAVFSPAMFVGLAFVPAALAALVQAALGRGATS